MSRVLVDTSVWVEMFRSRGSPAVEVLGGLLRDGLVCTHGLIRAEVLSGAKSLRDYKRLEEGFSALIDLSDPPDLWDRVGRARYRLARKGFQAAIADLVVAAAAAYHGRPLYTLDQDFHTIRKAINLDLFQPLRH